MANQKLSQLLAAAALTGTEIVPVVQGGQTRTTSTAAIADLRKGAWLPAILNGPWAAFGDPFSNAAYRKDGNRVHLRGLIKAGAGGSVIFILPVAFRPPARYLFLAGYDLTALARIDVKSNGEVVLAQPISGVLGWPSLDGVGFFAE